MYLYKTLKCISEKSVTLWEALLTLGSSQKQAKCHNNIIYHCFNWKKRMWWLLGTNQSSQPVAALPLPVFLHQPVLSAMTEGGGGVWFSAFGPNDPSVLVMRTQSLRALAWRMCLGPPGTSPGTTRGNTSTLCRHSDGLACLWCHLHEITFWFVVMFFSSFFSLLLGIFTGKNTLWSGITRVIKLTFNKSA